LDSYSAAKAADLIARFRKNGTCQCPTLIVWNLFAATDEFGRDPRLRYIPSPQKSSWQGDRRASHVPEGEAPARKRLLETYLRLAGEAHKSGVQFLAGSDFGLPYIVPGFSLHDELALFVRAGFTPMEALQTATINPAKLLGKLDSLGTVEKGKLADLVLLEANPLDDIRNTEKINAVVVNGRVVAKSELQMMLATLEAAANKP
jgi:imidazolonepropionase-like amidohydrolase